MSKNQAEPKPSRAGRQASLFFEQDFSLSADDLLAANASLTAFTIGHSNRTIEEFVTALRSFGIERLVDIRHFPRSRYNPQFNQQPLAESLTAAGIEYQWVQKLGGYREGGYLPYMKTADFAAGIEKLEALSRAKRTACMCAEMKWIECHRRHVSDVLSDRGWRVAHILDTSRAERHRLDAESREETAEP